jgi:hypothetical protein
VCTLTSENVTSTARASLNGLSFSMTDSDAPCVALVGLPPQPIARASRVAAAPADRNRHFI